MNNLGHSQDAGFSLLEMLVVLVIISLMLSLISSRTFNSLDAMRFDRAIKSIENNLQIQRTTAVVENTTYIFKKPKDIPSQQPNITYFDLVTSEGIHVSGDGLIIYSNGTCTPAELIVISDDGRKSRLGVRDVDCKVLRLKF